MQRFVLGIKAVVIHNNVLLRARIVNLCTSGLAWLYIIRRLCGSQRAGDLGRIACISHLEVFIRV